MPPCRAYRAYTVSYRTGGGDSRDPEHVGECLVPRDRTPDVKCTESTITSSARSIFCEGVRLQWARAAGPGRWGALARGSGKQGMMCMTYWMKMEGEFFLKRYGQRERLGAPRDVARDTAHV